MSTKVVEGRLINCVGILLSYNQECAHIWESNYNYCLLRCHRKVKRRKKVHSFPVIKFTNISVLPLSPATTLTLWHRCDNKYSSKGSHREFEKWTLNELIIPKKRYIHRKGSHGGCQPSWFFLSLADTRAVTRLDLKGWKAMMKIMLLKMIYIYCDDVSVCHENHHFLSAWAERRRRKCETSARPC